MWRTLFLCFLCFVPLLAFGQAFTLRDQAAMALAVPATGGGGDTAKDSVTGATTYTTGVNVDSGALKFGSRFTAGSSYTIHSIVVRLKKTLNPTGNIIAAIYNDSSSWPGTSLTSGSVAVSTISTTEGDITFTGLNTALTSGVTYWVVVSGDATPDGVNYADVCCATVASQSGNLARWNGSVWDSWGSTVKIKFTTYGQ